MITSKAPKTKAKKSFFDIEKTIAKNTDSRRWEDFLSLITNLNKGFQEQQHNKVIEFWEDYGVKTKDTLNMKWIDSIALSTAKRNIESDREKRSSKCFHNLVVKKSPLYPTDFSMFDQLDEELPNFKQVTEFYRGAFALNKSRPLSEFQAPRPVLLLGNPGIGKTYYAKKMAKLIGTHYRFFDANSISAGWVLSGNGGSWKGADAGLIFKEMAKSNTMSPILLFDEIDKINSTTAHSPFSVFHQLFEKENARTFYDEFVDVEFDASQIIYILTANDASNIAPSLLSRMNVFHIQNPNEEAMKNIAQDIYTNTLGGSKLFKKTLAEKEVAKLLKFTPRQVTQIISKNIFTQASQNAQSTRAKDLIITLDKAEKGKIGYSY